MPCTTTVATPSAPPRHCSNRSVITSSTGFPVGVGEPRLRAALLGAVEHQHGRRRCSGSRPNSGGRQTTTTSSPSTGRRSSSPEMSAPSTTRSPWPATVEFRRAVQQWWADGWDLLLTPTLAEPPALIGTFANDDSAPMAPMVRAAAYVPFTPPFNSSGQPAINLPLHWNDAGLPDRCATRRRLRPRGRLAEGGGAARGRPAVGPSPPRDLTARQPTFAGGFSRPGAFYSGCVTNCAV